MPSRNLQSHDDLASAVRDLDNQLQQIRVQNWDFKQRRIVNAARSIDSNDYVIQLELEERVKRLQDLIDALNLVVFQDPTTIVKPQELFADCSGTTTVPFGSFTDVTGCTLSLNRYGLYIVTAHVLASVPAAAGEVRVYLNVDGTRATPAMRCAMSAGTINVPGSMMWPVLHQSTTPITVKLQTDKSTNAGVGVIIQVDTRLHARWAGADVSTTN